MDKNKIIGLIVIVGLAYLVYTMMMGGDKYADAADQAACEALDPAGVWTDAVGTEGEDGYVAGSCAEPAPAEEGDDAEEGAEG